MGKAPIVQILLGGKILRDLLIFLPKISLKVTHSLIGTFASGLNFFVKLLTKHHLEFLSLKGGCTGSTESTRVKMPHCWKSHVTAQCKQAPR